MNRKIKYFKPTVSYFCRNSVWCQKLPVFKVLSFGLDTGTQLLRHLFIGMSEIRCSKSAQKSTVQVCPVASIVIETTQ